MHFPEFEGCKSIKGLVDAAVVEVREPQAATASADRPGQDLSDQNVVDHVGSDHDVSDLDANNDHDATRDQDQHHDSDHAASDEADRPGEAGFNTEDGPLVLPAAGDARKALSALIEDFVADETTHAVDASAEEATDGLADRGPWTSSELADLNQMGGWSSEEPDQASLVATASADHPSNGVDRNAGVYPGPGFNGSAGTNGAAHVDYESAHVDHGAALDHDATVDHDGAAVHQDGAAVDQEGADVDQEGADVDQEEGAEPINRGLLLKFLSSVRS
jgi:hypothetical protein